MNGIKMFVKNENELENLIQTMRRYRDDIGMEFSIKKMCHANNEKRKTTNNWRNRTAESRKNQNAWTTGNLQILANIGSGLHWMSVEEGTIF